MCIQNMSVPSTNPKTNNTQIGQKYVAVKNFYNKHFPTDRKTYNFRVPFVGLVISILSLHFLCTSFAIRWYINRSENYLIPYCYLFIAAALAYELYYGLKIGDRKQFTPWILLKFIEIILTFVTIIYIFVERWDRLQYFYPEIIYGIIILGVNGFVTYVVTMTSVKQLRGYAEKSNVDENVYDDYTYGDA